LVGKHFAVRPEVGDKKPIERGFQKFKRGGIVMRKLVRIGFVFVIIIGIVSGVASAKTLFVAEEGQISNSTDHSLADAISVDVKFQWMLRCSLLGCFHTGFLPTS